MKNLKRSIQGLLATLLFAVGLVQAADRLDPMSGALAPNDNRLPRSMAPSTGDDCGIVDGKP